MSAFGKLIFNSFLISSLAVGYSTAHAKDINITSKPIESFILDKPEQTQFGNLEFIGGLELTSTSDNFGGLSGLRLGKDGQTLFAVTDQGHFLKADIKRNEDGSLSGLENADLSRLRDRKGERIKGKKNADAEALEISGSQFLVGFERNHRIDFFNLAKSKLRADERTKPLSFRQFDFPNNKGPEAVALSPVTNELFVFAEYALDENDHHRGFIVDGKTMQPISVSLTVGYSLTDAHFLENGDLLMLERFYTPFTGQAMRIRKFERTSLKANALLEGEIIMQATSQMEIDNMEGLALSKMADGSTRVTMISDDNFSRNQRTVLLEFKLLD